MCFGKNTSFSTIMASVEGLVVEGASSSKSSRLNAVLLKLHSASAIVDSSANSPATAILPSCSPGSPAEQPDLLHVSDAVIVKPGSPNSDVAFYESKALEAESKVSERSSSSRRKQQKTRKVVDSALDTAEDSVVPPVSSDGSKFFTDGSKCGEVLQVLSVRSDCKPCQVQAEGKAATVLKDQNEGSNDSFVLPEGTVLVQPESVESSPSFQEIETSRAKSKFKGNLDTAILHCTACNRQIGADANTTVYRHPVLKVLICKKCYKLYNSGNIEQDVDGSDEQCRWCGQGGDLICCDYCHNAICKTCIRRNLGRKELSAILNSADDERWRCYVCDPKPLLGLIEQCTAVMEALARQERLDMDKKRKLEAVKPEMVKGPSTAIEPVLQAKPVPVIQSTTAPASLLSKVNKSFPGYAATNMLVKLQQQQSSRISNQQKPVTVSTTVAITAGDSLIKNPVRTTKTISALLQENALMLQAAAAANAVPRPGISITRQITPPTTTTTSSSNQASTIPQLSPNADPLAVIERLLQATNSMNVFLQSLRMDARRSLIGTPAAVAEKRREINGKLGRAYAAYARSFKEAVSVCNDSTVNQPNPRILPRVAVVSHSGAVPGLRLPGNVVIRTTSSSSNPAAVRPIVSNAAAVSRVIRPVLNQTPVVKVSTPNTEVIELSDSDEDSSKDNRSATVSVAVPSVVSKVIRSVYDDAENLTNKNRKRCASPHAAPATNVKRARHKESVAAGSAGGHVGEDGAMFDGDVDEIPADDSAHTGNDQNLQLYCVDADDEVDSVTTELSSKQSATKLANGRTRKKVDNMSDVNRNVHTASEQLSAS